MKKTRFTESQITGALKEYEAGKNVLDCKGSAKCLPVVV